jgi:hypothetical protein
MKNLLADRRFSRKGSPKSEGDSRQDTVELNRDRTEGTETTAPVENNSTSRIENTAQVENTEDMSTSDRAENAATGDRPQASRSNDWPYHQWAGDNQTHNASTNGYGSAQQTSNARRLSFWARIPEGVIEGAKFTAFFAVAIGVAAVMMMQEPPESPKPKQPSVVKVLPEAEPLPPQGVPTPPLSTLPQQTLPIPTTPIPQLSQQKEDAAKQALTSTLPLQPAVPIPAPLTPNASQKSLEQPLPTNPSSAKAPSAKTTQSTDKSSPPGSSTAIPSLPVEPPAKSPCGATGSPNPGLKTPCSGRETNKEMPTAADTNARVNNNAAGEVRNYFQGRWNPPPDLKESLKYSLIVNADGTLERVLPVSPAATQHIESTKMPLPGNPFIDPIGGKTSILLELSPNGAVKADLE